jgi:hypothetical protein
MPTANSTKYDLTGWNGEVSAFGSYLFLFFIAFGIGLSLLYNLYGLSVALTLFGLFVYYWAFVKKQRFKRIFFDESTIYVEDEEIPLTAVIKIADTGIIKYQKNEETKTLMFMNYPVQCANLDLLKQFHQSSVLTKQQQQ